MQIEDVCKDLDMVEPIINKYRNMATKNRKFGFELPFIIYARLMKSFFIPQSYGPRCESYIQATLGAEKICSNKDKGDLLIDGKSSEIKTSIISQEKDNANIAQIRPHQNVDYDIVIVDLRKNQNKIYSFHLSDDQMKEELFDRNIGTLAHGTKNAVKNNKSKEYAIRFKIGSNIFKRWEELYSSNLKESLK